MTALHSLSLFWVLAAASLGGLLCFLGIHGLRADPAQRAEQFGPRWAERLGLIFLTGFLLLGFALVAAAARALG